MVKNPNFLLQSNFSKSFHLFFIFNKYKEDQKTSHKPEAEKFQVSRESNARLRIDVLLSYPLDDRHVAHFCLNFYYIFDNSVCIKSIVFVQVQPPPSPLLAQFSLKFAFFATIDRFLYESIICREIGHWDDRWQRIRIVKCIGIKFRIKSINGRHAGQGRSWIDKRNLKMILKRKINFISFFSFFSVTRPFGAKFEREGKILHKTADGFYKFSRPRNKRRYYATSVSNLRNESGQISANFIAVTGQHKLAQKVRNLQNRPMKIRKLKIGPESNKPINFSVYSQSLKNLHIKPWLFVKGLFLTPKPITLIVT